ncbi:hypothetical protein TNCV_3950571 [Trichonephila clavipes]|nr:hypothetical protein TNCV_3950571 [Trichonephila clavipes]
MLIQSSSDCGVPEKLKQDLSVEYFGLIQLLLLLNDSTSTNIFPFSDSPEIVRLPGSEAVVPITPIVPAYFATSR